MRRPRLLSGSSGRCGAMPQFDGYRGRAPPSKKLIMRRRRIPTDADELKRSSARCSLRTRWQSKCWNRRQRSSRICGGSARLQGCIHACGVLARRRERGASNVLTTPPTPCMLGGHDGDSNSVKICGTPALLHPDPPPYIASQQENTHATYAHMCLALVD